MTPTTVNLSRPALWQIITGAMLIVAATAIALYISYAWLNEPRDLAVYLSSTRALIDRRNAWDAASISAVGHQYGYLPLDINSAGLWTLPMFMPFLVPFALLPYPVAAALWTALNLLIFVIVLHLMRRWLPNLTPRRWTGLILLSPPAAALLMWGQISGLVLLGYVLFLAFAEQRRDWLAGASLLLVTFKPHLGFLAVIWIAYWIVRERRWAVIGGAVLGLAIDLGLVFAVNPNWTADYGAAIVAPPLSYDASTLMRVVYRAFFPGTPWIQFAGLIVSAGILIAYLILKRPRPVLWPAVPFLLACSVTFAPYGWLYDQLIAWPAYLWLANELFATPPSWWAWGILVIPAALCYIQSGTHWGDSNPLLFWPPLLIVVAWSMRHLIHLRWPPTPDTDRG